jgi:uncharacterized membrane protein
MMRKNLLFILLLPILIFGKSYFYPEIKTNIYFTTDGSARVLQERTYNFDGSFSWAFVDLKKQGAENIILNQLSEKTDKDWKQIQPTELNNSPKSLYIRWGYSAENQTKTFLLDYTIVGGVKRYSDVAEFYWKVIEDEHEKISNNEITLFLPEPSPSLFKVYIHSQAKPGLLTFNDKKDQADIVQANIPANTFLEVRMLASQSMFDKVAKQNEIRYEKILGEEKHNFLVSSLRKFVLLPIGLLLMVGFPLVLLLIYYNKYGREPKLQYIARYEHEPPRKAPPIVVPAILHQKPEKTAINQNTFWAMFADLLDLCVKGIVSVQEVKEGHHTHYQFILEKPDLVEKLDPIDREVAKFFFEEVGESSVILTDKVLKEYAAKHSTGFQAFLNDLFQQTRDWWEKELGIRLIDPISSKAYNSFVLYIIPAILIGAIMVGNSLVAFFAVPKPVTFILPFSFGMIVFFVFMFSGRSILRWNEQAYLEQKRWQSFRKFLTDFSAIKDAPITLLPIWEQYFVYAVVLGVAQKFLKNITNLALERGTVLMLPIWYSTTIKGTASISSFAEGMGHFESFASNFTSMMNSFSSSAATGGGFSGGGGGGGGGGSSGAG